MSAFTDLLRNNRNYRYTWIGQVVSEVGDHFNTISVFSLALANTGSGMVVSGIMLSRAVPFLFAGPLAGVLLDRMDRRRLMIASDVVRAVVALGFVFALSKDHTWMLFILSGLLMFASPFFTSGRAAILPVIATPGELHTANSLTQTTQWTTTAIGGLLAGVAVQKVGYDWAFVLNSLSFIFSALCIMRLRAPAGTFQTRRAAAHKKSAPGWSDYREGLKYMGSMPLVLAIAMIHVGWATGGGAAQILFGLFGENVYHLGSFGIGTIWGCAGVGLVIGGLFAHRLGPRLSFQGYKRTIAISYLIHGGAYIIFSQVTNFYMALVFIAISRAAVAVSSVLNMTQLLTHVVDEYRGRVFATMETITWAVMMLSMTVTGFVSDSHSPRVIGFWAGILSSMTAFYWMWATMARGLTEPPRVPADTSSEQAPPDEPAMTPRFAGGTELATDEHR
jgi:MFS family permease